MAMLLSLLLIALGLLGAERVIVEKVPAAREYLAKLSDYRDIIGFIGIALGILSCLQWVMMLGNIGIYSVTALLLALIASLLTLGLGLILGLDFIKKNVKNPAAPLIVKAEVWRAKILAYQVPMALAAVVIGLLCLIKSLKNI